MSYCYCVHLSCVVRSQIPTTTPEETLGRIRAFLNEHGTGMRVLGIATFGPVDPIVGSYVLLPRLETVCSIETNFRPTFGYITTTPKPGWKV